MDGTKDETNVSGLDAPPSTDGGHFEDVDTVKHPIQSPKDGNLDIRDVNAVLANPLAGYTNDQLMQMGEEYARKHQLGGEEDVRAFRLAAVIARDPVKFEAVDGLTKDELDVLREEITHKWRQPRLLYIVIVLCSTCAAVQGMGKYESLGFYFLICQTNLHKMRLL